MENDKIKESIDKLFNTSTDNYVFVYTPPKVGSTTLVTSLRISLGKTHNIIHIHDETMLKVLTKIHDVKINDIIRYLSSEGKNVYVIDIYRTPIERKMSEYFEKISPYHFNNSEENISSYSINRITQRFNKLFPHIRTDDHYFEKYDIETPVQFDFDAKYTLQTIHGMKYIKLRLCDTMQWSSILSNLFYSKIVIINDYKTEDKGIGNLYKKFKREYRIPANYLESVINCKYFLFYYSETERNKYIKEWRAKMVPEFTPYTMSEYTFYLNLCLENQYINDVQIDHYIDNGCFCKLCSLKRKDIFMKASRGEKIVEKIIHNEVVNENIDNINKKLKTVLHQKVVNRKYKPNHFSIKIA